MIEIPRAALTAHKIAKEADFFSFGTNDLTQMTFGYSRDDVAKFLPLYIDKGILKQDPFAVLDQNGVGQLVNMAVQSGRAVKPILKCGICGEHGGEPSSVKFCHHVGLNYVPARRSVCPSHVWRQPRQRSSNITAIYDTLRGRLMSSHEMASHFYSAPFGRSAGSRAAPPDWQPMEGGDVGRIMTATLSVMFTVNEEEYLSCPPL